MSPSTRAFRDRLLPALLTAAGVTLIGAGLLSYSGTAQANPLESTEPTIVAASPGESLAIPTLPPLSSVLPSSPTPSAPSNRVATRIVIDAMGIDLPIVKPRGGSTTYPLCNVAMYIQDPPFAQPGSGRGLIFLRRVVDGERQRMKVERGGHGGPPYGFEAFAALTTITASATAAERATAGRL